MGLSPSQLLLCLHFLCHCSRTLLLPYAVCKLNVRLINSSSTWWYLKCGYVLLDEECGDGDKDYIAAFGIRDLDKKQLCGFVPLLSGTACGAGRLRAVRGLGDSPGSGGRRWCGSSERSGVPNMDLPRLPRALRGLGSAQTRRLRPLSAGLGMCSRLLKRSADGVTRMAPAKMSPEGLGWDGCWERGRLESCRWSATCRGRWA